MSNEHLKLVPTEPPSPAVDPLLGQVLDGRYAIEKVLGEGGMGLVYKARHTTLNKALAIKVLRVEVSKDAEIVARFRQEAQSATSIGNHHIIDISDFGVLRDGSTYFVMEFLDGIALTDAIEPGKPLDPGRTIHIAKQICVALGAAHDIGIVHRDLKPDNIYLITRGSDRDFVKVLDFGIAKVGGTKSKLTQVGQVFGTPHYMSPEQCAGTAVDRRTDIYALGVIMYEMTSSRVPFDADNLMGILTKHLYEEPIKPHELPPPVDVPPALEAVIMKCLAKKVESRYQSMQEVLADLELCHQGATPSAVMDGVRRASATGSGLTRPDATGGGALAIDVGEVPVPSKGKATLLFGALAAVVVLGGVGALLSAGSGEPSAPPSPPPAAIVEATPPVPTPAPVESPPVAEEPEAPAPAPAVYVVITSRPPAAVYQANAFVGNTPFKVPRPGKGEPGLDLELRAEGYEDFPLRVTELSQEALSIGLEKVRSRPSASPPRSGSSRDKPRAEAEPEKESAKPEKKPEKAKRGSGEVLDPWS